MSKEIKESILRLNERLEEIIEPGSFVLNPEVSEIMKRITDLQEKCSHSFIDKKCEYCGKEE
jgi:hypothetical protein